MASTRVISWILGNGLYAYIYMPNKKPRICGKIVEDSPLWKEIIDAYDVWGVEEKKYKGCYESLSDEVARKGYALPPYDPKFFNGGTDLDGYKLALLSGVGGGTNGYGGNNGGGHGSDYDPYKEFSDDIQKELDKARNELEEKKRVIEEFITENFNETYESAKNEIAQTKKELNDIRQRLEEQLEDAKDALDKARQALEDGVVDPDEMNEILNTIHEYSYWMDEYSGVVTSLKNEYDEVNLRIGSIGESEDVSKGLFAKFAACIDVLSGSVGTVHEWMDASEGTIGQIASWYNETLSSATEAIRFMSASAGVISDTISYIQGDGEDSLTTYLSREMDAINATIEDKIQAESSSGIASLRREMNALEGTITDQITRLDPSSALTSMGERMNALSGTMEQWMTIANDLSGMGIDLRDEWSEASGKLSTVAQLMAETDSDGNILYFVSGGSFEERVYKNENGQWVDAAGGVWDDSRVYVKYSTVMQSWFQQQANEISLGIEDKVKELIVGIDLSFSGDESYIKLIADKVVIDAEMIANAISAKTANIGGILMGNGEIRSLAEEDDGTPYFKLDGTNGKIYAQDAIIYGEIYAQAGQIGGFGLLDSKLTVPRDGNYDNHIAFLNGSDNYKDTERGILILSAGINTGITTYYKYVSAGADEYSIIYTKRKYSSDVGDSNNTEVIAYIKQNVNGVDKFVRCENQFYFIIEKVVDAAAISEDDIIVASSDGEENVVYKESVVRKYTTETSENGNMDIVYDYYSYESTIDSIDNSNANTKLYEDGTLFTETIIANGGYFSGELNAKGRFSGELQDATGTLKGVTVEANYLTGNIVLNTSNSLKAKSGQELYFNVGAKNLSDSSTKEYWNVDEVFWERQNANGGNTGQTYTKTLTIASISFKKGATVTIPAFSGSVYRYAPKGKTNKSSSVKIVCSRKYNNEINSQDVINKTILISSFEGSKNQTDTLSTEETLFTAGNDGTLTIKFTYNIHLSTYSWVGADKAYCKIKFNNGGSKVKVDYEEAVGGTSIASNGMRVLTSDGAKISAIDGKIELLSPNAMYGLQITDEGIKYTKDGVSWTNLLNEL